MGEPDEDTACWAKPARPVLPRKGAPVSGPGEHGAVARSHAVGATRSIAGADAAALKVVVTDVLALWKAKVTV